MRDPRTASRRSSRWLAALRSLASTTAFVALILHSHPGALEAQAGMEATRPSIDVVLGGERWQVATTDLRGYEGELSSTGTHASTAAPASAPNAVA